MSGPIPAWLGSLESLEQISLGVNELTGRIPNALGNLANLEWLYLGWNDLSGPIPRELANLDNLRALGLGWNDLSGPIPAELGRLERLEELSLGGNELTGRIPNALGNLANLRWLQLGWNDLSGPIPAELGRLERLEVLHLAYNWGLTGPLPSGLRRAPLEELDIWLTQACAPAAWQDWLETIEFSGGLCETGTDVTIDVLVVYTPAAARGGGRHGGDQRSDRPDGRRDEPSLRGEWGRAPRRVGGEIGGVRTPRRGPPATSTVSRIRRTDTWTRCIPYATGSGPTWCI